MSAWRRGLIGLAAHAGRAGAGRRGRKGAQGGYLRGINPGLLLCARWLGAVPRACGLRKLYPHYTLFVSCCSAQALSMRVVCLFVVCSLAIGLPIEPCQSECCKPDCVMKWPGCVNACCHPYVTSETSCDTCTASNHCGPHKPTLRPTPPPTPKPTWTTVFHDDFMRPDGAIGANYFTGSLQSASIDADLFKY